MLLLLLLLCSEGLLWVWGSSGKGAEAEAAATPLAALAPEVQQYGAAGFWSTQLFGPRPTDLGSWYQRCARMEACRRLHVLVVRARPDWSVVAACCFGCGC